MSDAAGRHGPLDIRKERQGHPPGHAGVPASLGHPRAAADHREARSRGHRSHLRLAGRRQGGPGHNQAGGGLRQRPPRRSPLQDPEPPRRRGLGPFLLQVRLRVREPRGVPHGRDPLHGGPLARSEESPHQGTAQGPARHDIRRGKGARREVRRQPAGPHNGSGIPRRRSHREGCRAEAHLRVAEARAGPPGDPAVIRARCRGRSLTVWRQGPFQGLSDAGEGPEETTPGRLRLREADPPRRSGAARLRGGER